MAAKRGAKERSAAPTTAAGQHFFVTRDSQNADKKKSDSLKLSYVGMRNLADVDRIDEQDILSASGTIRGRKNRVRAGLANFENPKALEKLNAERGKVVVYVTSFRGVRATFEECRYILDLFHNLRIRVVTKDIYMYQIYHKELEERLKHSHGQCSVPQVFIGGQHIGGKEELEELNEVGELRKILEEYPRYETANKCTVCAGFEFILCRKCGGSKNSTANKFTSEFRALRCTHCNVNGMEACPSCEQKRKELEEELKKQMEKRVVATIDIAEEEHKREQDKEGVRGEVGYRERGEEVREAGMVCQERGEEVRNVSMGGEVGRQERGEEGKHKESAAGIFEQMCEEKEIDKPAHNETVIGVHGDGNITRFTADADTTTDDFMGEGRETIEECEVTDREEAADIESDDSDSEYALRKYIYELDSVQF